MKRFPLLTPLAIALIAAPVLAAPGGPLRTLPRGPYECAVPGVAGRTSIVPRDEMNFRVVIGSSYERDGQRGTYLYTGKRVVFTSGEMRGASFERVSQNMLQETLEDGSLGKLRCVRRGN